MPITRRARGTDRKTDFLDLTHVFPVELECHRPVCAQLDRIEVVAGSDDTPARRLCSALASICRTVRIVPNVPRLRKREQVESVIEAGVRIGVDRPAAEIGPGR